MTVRLGPGSPLGPEGTVIADSNADHPGQAAGLAGDGLAVQLGFLHHFDPDEPRDRRGRWTRGGEAAAGQGFFRRIARGTESFLQEGASEHRVHGSAEQFVHGATPKIPGLYHGGHETSNGDLYEGSDMSATGQAGARAFTDWSGGMHLRTDLMTDIQARLADKGPVTALQLEPFETVLHELTHTDVDTKTYGANKRAYQNLSMANIEEGFTELGAVQHAHEFFDQMGLSDRPVSDQGGITAGQFADERARPENILKGQAWGHYGDQVAAAYKWCQRVAQAEGVKPGPDTEQRCRELADEMNAVGVSHKAAMMIVQAVRSQGGDPAKLNDGDWSALADTLLKGWGDNSPLDAFNNILADRYGALQRAEQT